MRKIEFTEPNEPAWRRWRRKCKEQRAADIAVVQAGGSLEESELYKAKSAWFKSVDGPFRGKCAYCEQKVTGNHPGDIEHYRPKSEVKKLDWSNVTRNEKGGKKNHPGYYWLRQELSNLLFSCYDCNRKNRRGKILFGKECRFPVDGDHAWDPDGELHEHAQLLNPCIDDPWLHLEFHPKTGLFSGKSTRGAVTIELLGLNKPELQNERRIAYNQAISEFQYETRNLHEDEQGTLARVETLKNDDRPAFASVRQTAIGNCQTRCFAVSQIGA